MFASVDNAGGWQNLPIDLNMVFGYYNRIDTNSPIDTSLPIDGLSLNANLYAARYARSFAVDGRNSAVHILQLCADISASFDNAWFFEPQPAAAISAHALQSITHYFDVALKRELGRELVLTDAPGPHTIIV